MFKMKPGCLIMVRKDMWFTNHSKTSACAVMFTHTFVKCLGIQKRSGVLFEATVSWCFTCREVGYIELNPLTQYSLDSLTVSRFMLCHILVYTIDPFDVETEIFMMTSANGNIFQVTSPLWTGNRWISSHKGQWRTALMFSLICAWINGWVNNG